MEEQDWKDGGGRNTDSILNVRGEMCVEQHHTDMNTRHVDLGVKLRRSEQRFGKGRRGWWRPGGGEMGDFRESSLAKTAECPEALDGKGTPGFSDQGVLPDLGQQFQREPEPAPGGRGMSGRWR